MSYRWADLCEDIWWMHIAIAVGMLGIALLGGCSAAGNVQHAPVQVVEHPEDFAIGVEEQELVGVVGLDPNPLTFWWYATAEEFIPRLPPMIEEAMFRWNDAACLNLDISLNAHHWVRFTDIANAGNIGGTWESSRIRIDTDLGEQWDTAVLMHEICHLLRRNNSHVGGICASPVSADELITQGDLDAVCAARSCGCQNPE